MVCRREGRENSERSLGCSVDAFVCRQHLPESILALPPKKRALFFCEGKAISYMFALYRNPGRIFLFSFVSILQGLEFTFPPVLSVLSSFYGNGWVLSTLGLERKL